MFFPHTRTHNETDCKQGFKSYEKSEETLNICYCSSVERKLNVHSNVSSNVAPPLYDESERAAIQALRIGKWVDHIKKVAN